MLDGKLNFGKTRYEINIISRGISFSSNWRCI